MKPSTLIRRGWIQGYSAMTRKNRAVNPLSRYAVKFCLSGAMYRVFNPNEYQLAMQKVQKVLAGHRKKYQTVSVVSFNDTPFRTKQEVIDVLKEAGL